MEEYPKVEIQGHKAKIKYIRGYPATWPLRREDELAAWIEFEESVGGTLGFFVPIPVNDYGKEELLEAIKFHGERVLFEIQERSRHDREERDRRESREKDLNVQGKALFDKLAGKEG